MSLQVWLPLTKDLRQQGISSAIATNSGATYSSTGGKLGGCYNFTTSSYQKIGFPYSLANYAEFTVCVWVKPISTSITGCLFTFINPNDYWQFVITSGNSVGIRDNSSGETGTRKDYTLGSFVANTWTHLAISYNKGVVKIYKDGVLFSTNNTGGSAMNNYSGTNAAIGESVTSSSSYYFAGSVNDFRVYNHCLSPMEVKELSKGLVLHYPLNRNGWGNDNALTNSSGYEGTNNYSGLVTVDYEDNKPYLIAKRTDTTSTSRTFCSHTAITSFVESWAAGSKFTISGYYKVPSTETYAVGANMFIRWNDGGQQDTGFTVPTSTEKDKWIRFENTYTVPTYEAGAVSFCLSAFSKGLATIYWRNIKLEYGDKATPWCPNLSDTLYTTMGLNGTTEYDCSGFCNNGIRIGTFDWTSNTSKYAVSQIFNGTNNAIQTPNLTTMITDKNYTIACWFYKTAIGTKSYQTIYGGPSGFELEARNASSTEPQLVAWNWGKPVAAYEFNKWNHFVFVHSDSDCKIYLNGEYISAGTAKASNPSGNYFVGAWNTSTGQNYEGLMSDFRIYATALSADDVLSLYQNSNPT